MNKDFEHISTQVNKARRKLKDKDKPQVIVSLATSDHLIETLYDPERGITSFAVVERHTGKGEIKESFSHNSVTYIPPRPTDPLIRKRFVRLASEVAVVQSQTELIQEIRQFIRDYVTVSPEFEEIIPFYVLLTWVADRFETIPYLRALGDLGMGKSRFLAAVGHLCYKPFIANGATTVSPIFRILDAWHPTLILDEADFKATDERSDITKIFNCGFSKNIPVLRSEEVKGSFEVRAFDVYGPKIFASRHEFGDQALESRCFTQDMDMVEKNPDVPITLDSNFYQRAQELQNKLLAWRFANFGKVKLNPTLSDPRVSDRLNQIALPLKSLAFGTDALKSIEKAVYILYLDLIDDRGMSREAGVLHAVLSLTGLLVAEDTTVKMITEAYNKEADDKEQLTYNKVGWIIRKRLKLKLVRRGAGFTLVFDDKTKKHLEQLKLKYGLVPTVKPEVNQ